MNFKRKYFFNLAIFTLIQYVFFCIILILIYTGGNLVNQNENSFSWTFNFLSDLGRTHYFNGEQNPFWIFYNISLSIVGISIIFLFYILSLLINQTTVRKLIVFFGILSGTGYALISVFPADLQLAKHVYSGYFGIINFLIANLLFIVYVDKLRYRHIYILSLTLSILIFTRIISLFYTNFVDFNDLTMLKLNVIAQKLIVFPQIFFSLIIFFKLRKQLT